jgi:hypothetical protein
MVVVVCVVTAVHILILVRAEAGRPNPTVAMLRPQPVILRHPLVQKSMARGTPGLCRLLLFAARFLLPVLMSERDRAVGCCLVFVFVVFCIDVVES